MKLVRQKGKGKTVRSTAPSAARGLPRRRAAPGEKGRGKQKFVLFIGDEGAILVYLRGATVLRRLFAASPAPDHTEAVLELMRSHPNVPLYVLADVIDQQYVRHSFPPVSALSVNNLVKRRLERDFQAEDITGSLRLGREKTGRKEWQYLLIALANTPLLQQWLDLLVEQPNEFKGIYLSPVEAQNYIAQLHENLTNDKPLPWQLLVSHHKVSGFRQVVLRNGKLVFTRVTQAIDEAVPAVIAGNIEQEILNTLEYLRRLGFLENNSLEITVIAAHEVQEALDVKRFNAGQSWVLTPLDVADMLGLEQAALSADRFGDVVMASAFARSRKPVLRLFTAYGQKLAQLYTAKRGLRAAAGALAAVLLLMSGSNVLQAIQNKAAISDIEARRKPVQAQLATVRKAIEGLNTDVAYKSAVTLTYDAYLKDFHPPAEFIDALAPLLNEETRVKRFVWGQAGKLGGTPAPTIPTTPGSPPPSPESNGPLEMRVDFEFMGAFVDTEALAQYVEAYVADLKTKLPQYTIINMPYPWQSQSQANVEISFDQQIQQAPMREGDNKVTLVFYGPKAQTANPPTPEPGMAP